MSKNFVLRTCRQGYDSMAAGLPHAPIPAAAARAENSQQMSPATSYLPTANRPATSTPVNGQKAHVTFSDSVIEITDSPKGAEGGEQNGKKVPPPPPPRRSSRTTFRNMSPTHGQPKRPFSPPAYENIENLNINVSGASDATSPQQVAYQRSVSAPGSTSSPREGAIAQLASQGPNQKPMSKFQQDLAAGIYANMNRPDLQGQKLNPAAVVNEAGNTRDELKDFSDNESSASSQDSQAGLARRMLAAKLDQEGPVHLKQQSPPRLDDGRDLNTSVGSTNGVKMREGKKVPPPPPVRRTSQLSSKPDNKADGNDSVTVEEKRRSVSELQKEILQQLERQGPNSSPPHAIAPVGQTPTPERNGVLPNQQHKHVPNGDVIRTDASFAINSKAATSTVTSITTQHRVTNIHVHKTGKKNETDIY